MHPYSQSLAKRTLVTVLAAVAFAISACGTDSAPEGAPPVEEPDGWVFAPYPHRADDTAPPRSQPDQDVRTPPPTGGGPTLPAKRPGIML